MAILTISTSQDFSSDLLFNIRTVDFIASASATFGGGQFNNVNISRSLHVDGSTGADAVIVNTDYRGFDASGWTFTAWTAADRLRIQGSDFSETLTGSAKRDIIVGGGGADTIRGRGGADIIAGGAGADRLKGGSGGDTLSYEDSPASVRVDLSNGTATGGDAAGDRYSGFEHLLGSGHADTLSGDAGANRITGGGGADTLRGRGGADTFIYAALAHSAAGAADLIADFSQVQGDRIDLSAIDAIAGGEDDAFIFIGSAAFTVAGQLRSTFTGLNTLIEADNDGDGAADLAILLTGRHTLTAADFIL